MSSSSSSSSFKDFRVLETLGKGSFATVYKVIRKSDNKIYALKRVKINKMSKKDISDALNEIRFLASIRHKNIVGFLEAFLENNETELCIIMEYCGCGDLAQKVERYKRRRQYIEEDVLWRYLIQCLKALQCIHEHNICHRDLKCANTFIAEDGAIKIGDMNVSKKLKNGLLQTQIGTPYYMSPEIWNNRPYDASSDIWSIGCMIYELASLKPPFVADSFPALKKVVTAGRYQPLPRKYSEAFHRVVGQMLQLQPRSRPTAEQLLRSPEFSSKLQLDQLAAAAAQARSREHAHMSLMETIRVPHNLSKLGLPKPCYPDVRPNSPTAWTVAEQHERVKQALPAMAEDDENAEPDTNRDDVSVASSVASRAGPTKIKPPSYAKAAQGPAVVPPLPPPTVAQAPGAHNRGHRAPYPPGYAQPSAAVAPAGPPPVVQRPGQHYQRAQYQGRAY